MNEAADSEKKMKQQNSLDLKAVEYIILKKKKVGYKVCCNNQIFAKRNTIIIFFMFLFNSQDYPSQAGKWLTKKCQKLCYTNIHWDSIKQI